MTEDLKNYLYVLFSKLSFEERREIMTYLKDMSLNYDITLQDAVPKIREKRYNGGFFCTHCSSRKVIIFGRYRERQRYLCRSCKKTFTDISKTALHCIRSKEKFFHAARLMLKGYSLTKTADRVKVSIPTAFNWRHKILDSLRNLEDDRLSGIVEADDTFFLHSQRGNRNIGRHPRKRGGKSKKRGISDEQVCVLVARDRNDNTISEIATFGRPSTEQIDKVLGTI
jgi:transposase-like protein